MIQVIRKYIGITALALIFVLGVTTYIQYEKVKSLNIELSISKSNEKAFIEENNELKEAMNNSEYILYAHTHNSINSKWVPWELGYFDSNKGKDKILVMPIINEYGKAKYVGQEYLTQYKEIEVEDLTYIESTEQKRKKFFEDIIKGAF